jgi:hypothetical protein
VLGIVWGAVIWGGIITLGGVAYAAVSLRDLRLWQRLARSGVSLPATIVDRQESRIDGGSGVQASAHAIAVTWTYGGTRHEKLLVVPRRVHDLPEGSTVQVVVDRVDPDIAMLEDSSSAVRWQLARTAGGLVLAAGGVTGTLLGAQG